MMTKWPSAGCGVHGVIGSESGNQRELRISGQDRDLTIFHNDRIVPLVDARLSPGQAGLFNGWGLFTTLRVYDGQPFAFERHWRRLSVDAARIHLPLDYQKEFVLRILGELIQVNHVKGGCVRIYLIYNKIGFWCSDESFPTVDLVVSTTELPVRRGTVQLGVRPYGRLLG